jgi:ATP-dependent RNA helicase DeaD
MENFDGLSLNPALLKAIKELGYEKPSPIQAQALPRLLGQNIDFIGLAATGTGKTAAFSLPLLERIKPVRGVQALILCPTRELTLQVAGQVKLLGRYLNVSALPIYGGAGYEEQLYGLRKGVSVVVGTPGRLIDHLKRGTLKLGDVRTVVLDEADEMISMGFREAIETILADVPRKQTNIWLFSATMSPAVRGVADRFLNQPETVQVNRTEMLSSTVEQYYYMTHEKNKPEVLCKLIDAADEFYGLIFCQTKSLVVELTRYLSERGYKVDCLHGDMSQAARETTMLAFRARRVKILVCTDVASRGLDVKDISHVINFSLPREMDLYVHRIGRTARSGKTGLAMSLVTPSHRHLLQKIERLTKSKLSEGVVPTRKSIGIKKISKLLTQFTDLQTPMRAMELMDETWKQTVAGMNPEEVAARFLSLMFPWVFAEQAQPPMARLTPEAPPKPKGREKKAEYRDEKRRSKRDTRKQFSRGFRSEKKRGDGSEPPRRRSSGYNNHQS